MKKTFFIVLIGAMLWACSDSEDTNMPEIEHENSMESTQLTSHDIVKGEQKVWVCYHPGTEFHNELCIEEQYPRGCYVEGDQHTFCWLLERKDCPEGYEGGQIEACKLFEDL